MDQTQLRARRNQIARTILTPILKAYFLGHLSTTVPRLLPLLIKLRNLQQKDVNARIRTILAGSLALNRFPSFCAFLVGSYTCTQPWISHMLRSSFRSLARKEFWRKWNLETRLPRFIAAFIASWLSLKLLNSIPSKLSSESFPSAATVLPSSKSSTAASTGQPNSTNSLTTPRQPFFPGYHLRPISGKTLDFTVLAVVRAIETIIGSVWRHHRARNITRSRTQANLETFISNYADATVFAASAGTIMWAWIYTPTKLPSSYSKWIKQAAAVDARLVEILRNARAGTFLYGTDTGTMPILEPMCAEYSWPLVWGNPALTIPLPCEVVHMGTGPSCHRHALIRFARAFRFAFAMYFPLQLLVKARNPSLRAIRRAVREALRSSAFLSAFIALFYYGICLARTRVGPKLFDARSVTPQMWDSGLCIRAGCTLCGWSILIEAERRRQEIAFFVAPKAVATWLPRKYASMYFWREQAVFAASVATLFTFIQEDPNTVRGVLGQVLGSVLPSALPVPI